MQPEETEAVGRIPSGLFIIAGKHGDKIDGFLGSFIQQASMQPLLLSMAVKPGRPVYDAIKSGAVYTVNIVGDHDKSFLKHFWKGYDPDNNPFDDDVKWRDSDEGGVILEGALAAVDCRLKESHTPGDHELVIAEVVKCYSLNTEGKPMTHTRKNGLSY